MADDAKPSEKKPEKPAKGTGDVVDGVGLLTALVGKKNAAIIVVVVGIVGAFAKLGSDGNARLGELAVAQAKLEAQATRVEEKLQKLDQVLDAVTKLDGRVVRVEEKLATIEKAASGVDERVRQLELREVKRDALIERLVEKVK
jgi:hypothetical protein